MPRLLRAMALLLVLGVVATDAAAEGGGETLAERDSRLIDEALAAMPPQRPGVPDLYVVGVAGDGHENVFRNEIDYLEALAAQRFGAGGRTIALVNHAESLGDAAPRPLATLGNLRHALAGIGRTMDPDEDLLLLYATTHGTAGHALSLQLYPVLLGSIEPRQLRAALDDAGIRNRILVLSACYSGGFIPALRDADTLVITAARSDRASFGCGTRSTATWFGHAWMVEGLNLGSSPIAAYEHAVGRIAERERERGFEPSLPQIDVGDNIGERLQRWQAALEPGPQVPYPYADDAGDDQAAAREAQPAH